MPQQFPDSLIPAHDATRLRTLHRFQIVNTTPELIFDSYTAWAAQLFDVPIALISLVDEDFVWFKSRTGGPEINGLVRNESMCSAAILTDARVIVSDYKPESCGLIKPDVAQSIGLNFYAGLKKWSSALCNGTSLATVMHCPDEKDGQTMYSGVLESLSPWMYILSATSDRDSLAARGQSLQTRPQTQTFEPLFLWYVLCYNLTIIFLHGSAY